MDVRGKAPVYIPPTYPPVASPATLVSPALPVAYPRERRTGLKIRIAFMLTVFFVVLQLHPVMRGLNAVYQMLLMRPLELANEYGCATGRGVVFTAVLFFFLALLWMRPL